MTRILAIEDQDAKWERVRQVVVDALPCCSIERVRDVYDAERLVVEGRWDLVILDISLDIRTGGKGRIAHDYTGGLQVAGRMYYEDSSIPTVIVTGFDSYPTGGAAHEQEVILGSEDVQRQAKKFLGEDYLGAVRYNSPNWEDSLAQVLKEFVAT
jgi:hypothetical protein